MKLYYSPGACPLAPHIVLRELGLPHTRVKVDLRAGRTDDGAEFHRINSKGYVPTIELDNGERLTETAVILQYLADRAPDAGLAPPPGSPARYRLQEWLNFVASEIHKGFGPLWKADSTDDEKQRTRARLGARLDWLARQMENRDFLTERFSVADAYLFTVLNWGQWTGVDLSAWPTLQEGYAARIAARPQAAAALRAEGLLQ